MRVKVREYIYYARKSPNVSGQQGQGGKQNGRHHGHQGGQGGGENHGPLEGPGEGCCGGVYGGQHQGHLRSRGGQVEGEYGVHHGHRAPGGHGGHQQEGYDGGQTGVPTFNRFDGLDTRP